MIEAIALFITFAIAVVGLIMLIFHAASRHDVEQLEDVKCKNRKNYKR